MADSDDLEKQLGLMARMNAVLQQISTQQQAVEKSMDAQQRHAQQTLAIMEKLRTANVDQKYREIAAAAAEAREEIDGISDTRTRDLGEAASIVTDEFEQMATKLSKTTKRTAVLGVAWRGMVKGFKMFSNVGTSVLGLFAKIAEAGLAIGAAIIAIPFKMFGWLLNTAAAANTGMFQLRQEIENVRKQFGDLGAPEGSAVLYAARTLEGFNATGLSSWRIFGTMAERVAEFNRLAKSLGPTFNSFTQELRNNGGALAAYNKGLGLSEEGFKGLASASIASGDDMADTLKDVAKQSLALGKRFGVSQKVIARDMGNAAKNVKTFGNLTIRELGVAATYAAKLGAELNDIAGVMDAFDTFESAAENSAKLSQTFGASVDAFSMLTSLDPADRIDQLRNSLRSAGKDASTFDRYQLKVLASTTNLTEEMARQVFSANNYGVSMDDIKSKSEEAQKTQMSQTEAMSKLADSIERMVKQGHALKGSFFEMFFTGFARGIMTTKEFRRMILNVRSALRETMMVGVRYGRAFVEVFPGVRDVFMSIAKIFERGTITQMGSFMLPAFKHLIQGKKTFKEFFNDAKTMFEVFFDSRGGPLGDALNGFKKFWLNIARMVGDALPWVGERVAELLTTMTDYLTGKKKIGMIDTTGVNNFWSMFITPLVDGFEKAWDKMSGPLANFLEALSEKLIELLTSARAKAVYKKVAVAAGTAIFGTMASHLGQVLLWEGVKQAMRSGVEKMVMNAGVGNILSSGLSTAFKSGIGAFSLSAGGILAAAGVGWTIGKWIDSEFDLSGRIADALTNLDSRIAKSRDLTKVPPDKLAAAQMAEAEAIYVKNYKDLMMGMGSRLNQKMKQMAAATFLKAGGTQEALDAINQELDNARKVKRAEQKGASVAAISKVRSLQDAVDPSMSNIGNQLRRQAAQMKVGTAALEDIKRIGPKLQEAMKDGDVQKAYSALAGLAHGLQRLDSTMAAAAKIENIESMMNTLQNVKKMMRSGAIKPAFDAIKQMVALTQDLDNQLSQNNKIDISTRLGKFAQGAGLGSRAQYTVKSKDVNIHVNLSVTLEAGELEKVMIMRKESIIRDRINFATTKPDSSAVTEIPDTYKKTIPMVTG